MVSCRGGLAACIIPRDAALSPCTKRQSPVYRGTAHGYPWFRSCIPRCGAGGVRVGYECTTSSIYKECEQVLSLLIACSCSMVYATRPESEKSGAACCTHAWLSCFSTIPPPAASYVPVWASAPTHSRPWHVMLPGLCSEL